MQDVYFQCAFSWVACLRVHKISSSRLKHGQRCSHPCLSLWSPGLLGIHYDIICCEPGFASYSDHIVACFLIHYIIVIFFISLEAYYTWYSETRNEPLQHNTLLLCSRMTGYNSVFSLNTPNTSCVEYTAFFLNIIFRHLLSFGQFFWFSTLCDLKLIIISLLVLWKLQYVMSVVNWSFVVL